MDQTENGIREIRINKWPELVGELFGDSHKPSLDSLHRYRSPYAFRGLVNLKYKLVTSLVRLGHEDPEDIKFIERRLLESFKKYAHGQFDHNLSIWHWISLGQHHGLPTRLLDWTYSPFVALHFATHDLSKMDDDGVVWCVDVFKIRQFLPNELLEMIQSERVSVFSIENLAKLFKEFSQFDNPDASQDFMVFFEPPSLDNRIINQCALFSFLSRPELDLDDWLARVSVNNEKLCKKIIIDKSLKWEVRDKLDQANITERVLFPGLDGLSAWLRRWYFPKPASADKRTSSPAVPGRMGL